MTTRQPKGDPMTVTDRTDATDEEFRARIARFEAAPTPPEVEEARVIEEVARALTAPMPEWRGGPDADYWRMRAAAAVAALDKLREARCWAMADDEDPDCPIGSARCVRPVGHKDEHVWEADR